MGRFSTKPRLDVTPEPTAPVISEPTVPVTPEDAELSSSLQLAKKTRKSESEVLEEARSQQEAEEEAFIEEWKSKTNDEHLAELFPGALQAYGDPEQARRVVLDYIDEVNTALSNREADELWRREDELKSELMAKTEPENALEALSQGEITHPFVSRSSWMEDDPSTDINEEEVFDRFVVEQVQKVAKLEEAHGGGEQAAQELAEHFEENRADYLKSPTWMMLEDDQRGQINQWANMMYDSVWKDSTYHTPPTGFVKTVFDHSLGVAGLNPVLPDEGTMGKIADTAQTFLNIASLWYGFGKPILSGIGFATGAAKLQKVQRYAQTSALAYTGALPFTATASSSPILGIPFTMPLDPWHKEYFLGSFSRQGSIVSVNSYERPTGPREGYLPFLYSDLAGWRLPFGERMRAIDIQRSRDLWREVDGVGSHISWYVPVPGDIDEDLLNNTRSNIWMYVENLREESETPELFIERLLELDTAIGEQVGSHLRDSREQQHILMGIQFIKAVNDGGFSFDFDINQMYDTIGGPAPAAATGFEMFRDTINSLIPNLKDQDLDAALQMGGVTPVGAEGLSFHLAQQQGEYFDLASALEPGGEEEIRRKMQVSFINGQIYQEVQRTIGSYLSHYQTGTSGTLDTHKGTLQPGMGFDELLNPVYQAPGAGFHDEYEGPGQPLGTTLSSQGLDAVSGASRTYSDDELSRMFPDGQQRITTWTGQEGMDYVVQNFYGAPRLVADAYLQGKWSRKAVLSPLASLEEQLINESNTPPRVGGPTAFSELVSDINQKLENEWLPTFQEDYYQYDPIEGGYYVANFDLHERQPEGLRPWQKAEHGRVSGVHSWGMIVGPNDDVWNIAERARELSPNERSELLNSLRESWKIASHRRMNLLGRASNTMPGATRSVMEMYRNAYSSDLQTLRVIIQAVGGYDSQPSSIERMNQFLMGTSQPYSPLLESR